MKIVIVGGGTAGWIASYYLSKTHQCINISSEEIPIIGVGEGTTGKFLDILAEDRIKLMIELDALPKLGIKFEGWSKTKPYFWSPIDGTLTQKYYIDYSTFASSFADLSPCHCSDYGFLLENGKTNFYIEENNLICNWDHHALHLDAYKTAEYFKKESIDNGVEYYDAKVLTTNREYGNITSIELDNGLKIDADLYVDCSGFSRVLNNHQEWIDYTYYLPVNRAVVFSIEELTPRKEYTLAKAMKYGWVWEIPTRHKVGRGYVYCDKYASEDDILFELREVYGSIEKLKSIEFSAGRINNFMDGNCLSVGLSSGFLEPLQATSIHCALIQIELFSYSFTTKDHLLDCNSVKRYNQLIARLYDDMRDFVSLHYTGGKTDTEFWSSFVHPERVQTILDLSNSRLTRSFDFEHTPGTVKQESWNPILSGLGHFPKCLISQVFAADNATIHWWLREIYNHQQSINMISPKYLSANDLNEILIKYSLGMTLKAPWSV
ncbi:Tryptophan Halognenase [Synechococcus phage S-PM2]|uniref:Tryptophan Halognenase n=1 Tax=Synechococcus phage S-PM2 TaxID=238854 RepID=A0A0M6VY55_BPSYP|nr:Tryptophan Halognenase [Synechococcus phage S-PM2]